MSADLHQVYTRREHLRRHQRKHKRGAYACNAPGCTCTFHSPALLERHRRHDWCFPFELPEIYLFRCPSHPELAHRSGANGGRSTSATPVSPSDDGAVSSSPASAHADFASSPEDTFNITSFAPRTQYLQVPTLNGFYDRHNRGPSHRPIARSGNSSPAVMQRIQNNSPPSILPGHPKSIPGYFTYYTSDAYGLGTDSTTGLDLPVQDDHTAQGHQPMLRHSISLADNHPTLSLPQSYFYPLIPGQHAEPRYSGSIASEIDSLSASTYVHTSQPVGTKHGHGALNSFGLPDQSFQDYGAVFEGEGSPITLSPDQHQEQMSSAAHPSSSEDAYLQPIDWMTRTNAPRSHSTGNLDVQHLARWFDEHR
ncbi:hypothetical protein KCU91_g2907, partial [Aureobasidium melanogenum]